MGVEHTVYLDFNESVDIVLPGGKIVSVLLSYLEPGEQCPELDIMLPESWAVNNYGPGLEKIDPVHNGDFVKQIIVIVELDDADF